MALSVDVIPNRSSPPAILLREAKREGKRIRRTTVANLSKAPPAVIDAVRAAVKGGVTFPSLEAAVTIRRSLPCGCAAAVIGTMKRLGFPRLLGRRRERNRDLAMAAVAARIIDPASKLATARALSPETATSSLGAMIGTGPVEGNEILAMLDWLLRRQSRIEKSLARRHLTGGTLILYDLSSSYLEGRCCPLAEFGYSRDGKRGRTQINYGLLCAADGCPAAVEVFPGNAADPDTVAGQVRKIRSRFGIERVALVGDRGMLTTARIREDVEPAGLDWISALKTQDIRKLLKEGPKGEPAPLVPETLLPDAVAEITGPDFPGERLMVCLNPRLREERRRKREELLQATEETLAGIAAAAANAKPGPENRGRIIKALGKKANRRKVGKHFDIEAREDGLDWSRNAGRIREESRLDGICIVRTSLGAGAIGPEAAVEAYKSLAGVERAFRCVKSGLRIRPVYVCSADHVRAHVFLCMLAYHVEWHMRRSLAPILFQDHDREGARAQRKTPVEPAKVSKAAKAKTDGKRTPDGLPVHSFTTLLADLGTLTLNEVTLPGRPDCALPLLTKPTPLQRRAFELLKIDPAKNIAM